MYRSIYRKEKRKVSEHGQTNTMESMRSNGNGTKPGVPFDD